MYGKSNIHGIEYFSHKSNKWKYSNIKDLKALTILGYNPKCNDLGRWNTGHNLSIIFGQEQKEVYEDIIYIFSFGKCEKNEDGINIISNDYLPFTIYLIGENNVKIPVLCAEGNGWSKCEYDEETACIFVYLPAMIFDDKFDTNEHNNPIKEINNEKG